MKYENLRNNDLHELKEHNLPSAFGGSLVDLVGKGSISCSFWHSSRHPATLIDVLCFTGTGEETWNETFCGGLSVIVFRCS